MRKYVKTTGIFFGIWFIASLLNGLLCGISMVLLESNSMNETMGNWALAFICSYVFSAPLVGFAWFVTVVAQANDKKGDALLQLVLSTALFCSMAAAVIFINTLGREFMSTRYILGLCIIISALASVLVFRNKIKTNV